MNTKHTGLATRCVHAGEIQDSNGSPHTPIYTTTTFKFDSTADLLNVVEGRKTGSLYTRYGLNPTIRALEEKLASQLPQLGIPTYFLLGSEPEGLKTFMEQDAGLVLLETPTNPTLEVLDIAAISDTVHEYGALLAVDNTFASPVNQNPLELGADFVIHNATKYLGGHSNLTAGALDGIDPFADAGVAMAQEPGHHHRPGNRSAANAQHPQPDCAGGAPERHGAGIDWFLEATARLNPTC